VLGEQSRRTRSRHSGWPAVLLGCRHKPQAVSSAPIVSEKNPVPRAAISSYSSRIARSHHTCMMITTVNPFSEDSPKLRPQFRALRKARLLAHSVSGSSRTLSGSQRSTFLLPRVFLTSVIAFLGMEPDSNFGMRGRIGMRRQGSGSRKFCQERLVLRSQSMHVFAFKRPENWSWLPDLKRCHGGKGGW
jgi:hypothetical protein